GTVFLTPFIFFASLLGIFLAWQKKEKYTRIFLVYFLIALFLEIIVAKSTSTRYIVAFLPFLTIPCAYVLTIWWERTLWKKLLVAITIVIPLFSSFFLVSNPTKYISSTAKITSFADGGYIEGQTSGYGITQ